MASAAPAWHPAPPRIASPATAAAHSHRPATASRSRCRASPQHDHTGNALVDRGCSTGPHASGNPPPTAGGRARSCALGDDQRKWRTFAPPWRRRNATAAQRLRSRPDPSGSSSSRTGARVPRLALWTRCLSSASAGGLRRPKAVEIVKPAALPAAGFTTLCPYRFSAYAIVTATGTPSPRPWARNAIRGYAGEVLNSEITTVVCRPCTGEGKTTRCAAHKRGAYRPTESKTLCMRRSSMRGSRESPQATGQIQPSPAGEGLWPQSQRVRERAVGPAHAGHRDGGHDMANPKRARSGKPPIQPREVPTLNPAVCHRDCGEYGRQREGTGVFDSPTCCTTSRSSSWGRRTRR